MDWLIRSVALLAVQEGVREVEVEVPPPSQPRAEAAAGGVVSTSIVSEQEEAFSVPEGRMAVTLKE